MARTKTVKAVTYTDTTVAVIGSVEYETLQLAVDNVADNETVQLVKSVSESVTIPVSKTFTLDLGSNTLTNVDGNHTITNNGTVTITGSGTVDNITHEKAALWNNGTATLTGNTYTRSQENGQGDTDSGGNSYYTIVNHETMTINEGTTVTQNGKFSSMVENGWYDGTQNESKAESVLIINGGNFTGGLNSIKNDDYGKLTINNGTFNNVAQAAVLNWNDTTITNGTFNVDDSADCVIMNGCLNDTTDKGALNIQGGTFTASSGTNAVSLINSTNNCGNITISGGTLYGDVQLDKGKATGGVGSLVISGSADINGSVIQKSGRFDTVTISGGSVSGNVERNGVGVFSLTGGSIEGNVENNYTGTLTIDGATINGNVSNTFPGTVLVTSGTIKNGITNSGPNGKVNISGGNIEGAVTNTGEGSTIGITGGTFNTDISEFVDPESKYDPETGTVSEKVKPTIVVNNLPESLQVNQETDFSVTTVANDYAGTTVEVTISYDPSGLTRENGGITLKYEATPGNFLPLEKDTFGPTDGFSLANATTNFKVTGNTEGTCTVTLNVVEKNNSETLCSSTPSVVQFTAAPVVTKYTVTVTGGTGSGEYEVGASVTCIATIPESKEFEVWQVEGITGAVLGNSTLTFSMPANNVTCTATFKDSEQPEPEPTPTPENGWYYIVEETGITIYGLARRFNIPVNKLMKDNNITEYRPLYKGEQILIIDDGTEKTVPQTDCWIG